MKHAPRAPLHPLRRPGHARDRVAGSRQAHGQALFDRPLALALFGSTGLLVSDSMNCRLRLIPLAE